MIKTVSSRVGARSIASSVLMIVVGSASGTALADRKREAFVETHRCAVVERLRGPRSTSRNRFLIVSDARVKQSYVQCIFFDEDTRMHCEASSAAYGPRTETLRFALSQPSAQALQHLGFVQADPEKNYVRDITLGTPPDFDVAAALMLGALHDAYGARTDTQLEFTAPMAVLPFQACPGPVS